MLHRFYCDAIEEKKKKKWKKMQGRKRNRKIVHSSSGLFADKGVSMYAVQTLIAATGSMRLPFSLFLSHSLCVSLSASLKFMWHFLPFFCRTFPFWPPCWCLVKQSISNEINGSKWIRTNNIARFSPIIQSKCLFLRIMAICFEQTEASTFKSNIVLFLRSNIFTLGVDACVSAILPFFD